MGMGSGGDERGWKGMEGIGDKHTPSVAQHGI